MKTAIKCSLLSVWDSIHVPGTLTPNLCAIMRRLTVITDQKLQICCHPPPQEFTLTPYIQILARTHKQLCSKTSVSYQMGWVQVPDEMFADWLSTRWQSEGDYSQTESDCNWGMLPKYLFSQGNLCSLLMIESGDLEVEGDACSASGSAAGCCNHLQSGNMRKIQCNHQATPPPLVMTRQSNKTPEMPASMKKKKKKVSKSFSTMFF